MESQPRKTIRHFHEPSDCHELTFSCFGRRPLLTPDRLAWLAENVQTGLESAGFCLSAYVFMPEHVHLLVYPQNPQRAEISRLLKAIKQPFSSRIRRQLESSGAPLLQELMVPSRHLKSEFRFWQQGPGYDRNLHTVEAVLSAVEYTHMNPVRRGLCRRPGDWEWSSARFYLSDGINLDPPLPTITRLPATFLM